MKTQDTRKVMQAMLISVRRWSKDLLTGSAAVTIFVGLSVFSAKAAALTPATSTEYVGLGMYSVEGNDLATPERVDLSITQDQWFSRGAGSGWASASGVLPLPTELDLSIVGGTNLSGMGGTAFVQTRYQFSVPHDFGDWAGNVPLQLITSGSVTVDSSLSDGFLGTTFARLSYPGGQVQATNEDASGGHKGTFAFDRVIDLSVMADTAYTIDIYLYSHGQGAGTDFFYNAHAFLDPIIQIEPNFAYRDQFHIEYSPGISAPIPPVPEPATLGLMLTGLVGIGAASRMRKRGRL